MSAATRLFEHGLVWLRRDLRLEDHAPLSAALAQCRTVSCAFVFDRTLLAPLLEAGRAADRRVEFIRASLVEIDAELHRLGGALIVLQGDPCELIPRLARELGAAAVFVGEDYEPAARARDATIASALARASCRLIAHKDQVILHKDELKTGAGRFFSIFTPYKRAWLRQVGPDPESPLLAVHDTRALAKKLRARGAGRAAGVPTLKQLGFVRTNLAQLGIEPGASGAQTLFGNFLSRIDRYDQRRDIPADNGPSYLSVHLRFGTISLRTLVRAALARLATGANPGAATWLSELIWREFFFQILYHRADVVEHAFRREYDAIQWEQGARSDDDFERWCRGQTGYPLVDAAQLQLCRTGYMHNRLRMVSASFLVKDLGIDWRRGADYFALHLNDFELSSNNGGWQWAASTGCDAQPYFRIFNPVTQSRRFDPEGAFIRHYLPQLAHVPGAFVHSPWTMDAKTQERCGVLLGRDYPLPLVLHESARQRTLQRFASARAQQRHALAAGGPTAT